jgi:hypothetical protein
MRYTGVLNVLESGGKLEEVVMDQLKIFSRDCLRGTKENKEKA